MSENKIENGRDIGGFTRSDDKGKPNYSLVPDGLVEILRDAVNDEYDEFSADDTHIDYMRVFHNQCHPFGENMGFEKNCQELIVTLCMADYNGGVSVQDFSLLMLRMAELYTAGAEVHGAWNWSSVSNPEVIQSCKESGARHYHSWMRGDDDEDHFAACVWNLYAMIYHTQKLNE